MTDDGGQTTEDGKEKGPTNNLSSVVRPLSSVPRVADQPLLPAPEQHQGRAEHPEHDPGRLVEDHLDPGVPQPWAGAAVEEGFERRLAVLVDVVPGLPEGGESHRAGRDRAGAVDDQRPERPGEEP